MKLLIFGATGPTGKILLKQAIDQKHEVTAFVRNPQKLRTEAGENLRVVKGDILDAETVEEAVKGQDAVLSVLGNTIRKPNTVLSDGTRNIIRAMEKHGVRRFVCMTSLGCGDSRGQDGFVFGKIFRPLLLREVFADKDRQEEVIKQSNLDWVIVRPAGLINKAEKGNFRAGTDKSITAGRISRADAARFTLEQATSDKFLLQTPAIAY